MSNLPLFMFSGALVVAAINDFKCRKIPNWLTYPLILSSAVWLNRYVLISIAIAIFGIFLFGELIGAGDIKLGLGITLWSEHFKWSNYWILFTLAAALLGALLTRNRMINDRIALAPYMAVGFVAANASSFLG